MKLVTWNVNSLKARLPRVLELLAEHAPDVVALQETKCTAQAFPEAELRDAGYEAVHHSGGRWAGVAVLARAGLALTEPASGLPGEAVAEEARWVEADVGGLRVCSAYVTNGREVGSETFAEKLQFLDALAARTAQLRREGSTVVVMGDFNVAPADLDVYEPEAFAGGTHVTAEERGRLAAILAAGVVDAYRHLHPEEVQHTWWDYRQGHFHRGMGLRIDLVLVDASLTGGLRECGIARDYRKGSKPSDHAPLITVVQEDAAFQLRSPDA